MHTIFVIDTIVHSKTAKPLLQWLWHVTSKMKILLHLFSLILITISSVSLDCPDMINFATGLNLHLAQPEIMNELITDCCAATRITCISLRVTYIDWYYLGLNGTINGTAIPSTVIFISLSRNLLSGNIPVNLPTNLGYLYLYSNRLSGDVSSLPANILFLHLGRWNQPGNQFTGNLTLNKPKELYINDNFITNVIIKDTSLFNNTCDLSNNPLQGSAHLSNLEMCAQASLFTANDIKRDCPDLINFAVGLNLHLSQPNIFTEIQNNCCRATNVKCISQRVTLLNWSYLGFNGSINGTAIPSTVTYLSLSRNSLTGTIPTSLPPGLVSLYLYDNKLTGVVPSFPQTLRVLHLGRYGFPGNQLTGRVYLYQPQEVFLNDNLITDVVIQNTTLLTDGCSLSNNPLLGNPNIANLTMCAKNGLFGSNLPSYRLQNSTSFMFTFELPTISLQSTSTNFSRN